MRICIQAALSGCRGSRIAKLYGRNHSLTNIPLTPLTDPRPSMRLSYNLKNRTLEFFREILFSHKMHAFWAKRIMMEALFSKTEILISGKKFLDKYFNYAVVINFQNWSEKYSPRNLIHNFKVQMFSRMMFGHFSYDART